MLLLMDKTSRRVEDRAVAKLLASLWKLYDGLKVGEVPDLAGVVVPSGNLQVLVGYGPPVVDSYKGSGASLLSGWRDFRFQKPTNVVGGGPIYENCMIEYDKGVTTNPGHATVAFQFTAETPLAVERAVVETWKLLYDEEARLKRKPALEIRAVYGGSQRDDGRSWIDFHDGLSNLAPEEREGTIFIDAPTAATDRIRRWPDNGTFMAFIRLGINLPVWRDVGRRWSAIVQENPEARRVPTAEEQIIGRTKIRGCPIVKRDDGRYFGEVDRVCRDLEEFVTSEPKDLKRLQDRLLPQSHIVRVVHDRKLPPASDESRRMFRQGYPFLETTGIATVAPDDFRHSLKFCAGLNFVSFQRVPMSLIHILQTGGWLGRDPDPENDKTRSRHEVASGLHEEAANGGRLAGGFGGPFFAPDPGDKRGKKFDTGALISAHAAGTFFVPPWAPGERFPGQRLLRSQGPARATGAFRAARSGSRATRSGSPSASPRA
jgi:deferrochelatase/peroxidase EfeB